MLDTTVRSGFWFRLAVISVIAATAASATAQGKAPPPWKNAKDCFKRTLTLPDAQLSAIATQCGDAFQNAQEVPDKLANAGFHAGTAYYRNQDYLNAVKFLDGAVRQGERNPKDRREDAKFQLARAFVGQGSMLAAGVPERAALFGAAISKLDEILASPAVARGTDLYSGALFERANAYLQRGSGTLDFNNAIDGFAVLAEGGPGISPTLRDDARRSLIKVAVDAGANELKPEANDSAAAQRAVALYEKALRFDASNLDLNLGLGDARLIIAKSASDAEKIGWFNQARRAYETASASAAGGPQASAARAGLGRSIRGVGLLTAGPSGEQLLRDAITQFRAAATGSTNLKVISELAETQVDYAKRLPADSQQQKAAYSEAEKTYETASKQPSLPRAEQLAILVELAKVQEQQGNRRDAMRATLEKVLAIDPGSVIAQVKLGTSYFNEGMFDQAKVYLRRAAKDQAGRDRTPATGEAKDIADAHYLLSRIDTERGNPGDAALKQAIAEADVAVNLGASDTRYRDQACLARIRRGKDSVTAQANWNWCTGNDQPEGLLLRGMFFLRQAQHWPTPEAKASARNSALLAFDDGFRKSVDGPVRDRLQYGKVIVVPGCSRFIVTDAPPFDADRKQKAREFFEQYHVFQCVQD